MLFSPAMVSALLDGSKTQTRRIFDGYTPPDCPGAHTCIVEDGWAKFHLDGKLSTRGGEWTKCPHTVGSFIWVREEHWAYGLWKKNGRSETGRQKWKFRRDKMITEARFETSNESPFLKTDVGWYKRLARFMFRRDSRITLEVTGVKIEKLNDISEADAKAEGCQPSPPAMAAVQLPYRNAYRMLWESIHGTGSWARNDWVWTYTFRRVWP